MAGGGLATSIVVFAVGAVLRFALTVSTVSTVQHGFNIHTVGVILMIVGAVGAVLSLIAMMSMGMGRHRTVIDDGRGNLVRRDDTYI
jgi:formate hydrogenlyase subunit 3/multisubunit Na+/H+ antiporter MnhD subunit